jgi:ATP-dependent exoDNAse (exonuclease V) beta subunit
LTIIPAGAGSGKTYRITKQLAEWVKEGRVAPDRIAAVTFTEAAASELRGRIRSTLIERGRLEDAHKLDSAFITTIHGFGKRLLVEYAFEAGHCPAPRLLAEDEEQLLLRKAISRIDRIEPISRRLYRFGYRYSYTSGTDVEQFRQRILGVIHMLRVIGGDVDWENRLNHCLNYITKTYGPTGDAELLTAALRRRVALLFKQYPQSMRDVVDSNSAKSHVESDFKNPLKAAKTDALNEDWSLWKSLQNIKVFQNDKQLPADYIQMAHAIMTDARELSRHPGPLDDARRHADALMRSAKDALLDYAGRKRNKGIIDYTDMIDGARRLMAQPQVVNHFAGRLDCLVIDEFQDTNPLQFSFLWKIHEAGVPAMIVGDLKQSIMGFQSADPRLMRSLISRHPGQGEPLNTNWRSAHQLMAVLNACGGQLFGNEYVPLEPKADFESRLHPLEVIHFEGKGVKNPVKAQHVAVRIKALLSDDQVEVFDRHLKRHRPIRGEDIAILGLTHDRLKAYADALRELGIRAQLAQDGWFESRPVQLAYYALSFVSDPQDRHAALYLSVTELGEDDLTSAVKQLLDGKQLPLHLLQRLKALSIRQHDLSVDELVAETIETMNLFDIVATWPDANQARANLLRLIAEAEAFVTADREALAGGGYYGSGLKTFLSWLCGQMAGKDGNRQPDAQVHDEQAVQLCTWHSAKGKEWPIVVVTTLDRKVSGRLPSLDVQYTDFSRLDQILKNARLVFSPSFAACETNGRFLQSLNEKAHTESLNLLYVALTRAREQLILEWEPNLENSSAPKYWHILRKAGKVQLVANELFIGDKSYPCRVIAADREPPLAFAAPVEIPVQSLPTIGRRALKYNPPQGDLAQLFITPSRLTGQQAGTEPISIKTLNYGKPLSLSLPHCAELGLLIHRSLELLGQGVSQDKARGLLDTRVADDDWVKIRKMAESFTQHITENLKPTALHWEVPVISKNRDNSVIGGTIDLLIETADGYWIVDHKSEEPHNLDEAFNHHLPQLQCYAQALLEGLKLKIKGLAIHWAFAGSISLLLPVFRRPVLQSSVKRFVFGRF